jgi:hypothetical protein
MPRHILPTPFIIHPPDDLPERRPDLRRHGQQLASLYADN